MPAALAKEINRATWLPYDGESVEGAARRRDDTQATLTSFVLGDEFSVGSGDARSDLKIMNPRPGGNWEAWELRPTRQRPKTRVFGVMASYSDFVAWSCLPKGKMTTTEQTNAANTAVNNIRAIIGNQFLSFKSRPSAAQIGGEQYGWYDE